MAKLCADTSPELPDQCASAYSRSSHTPTTHHLVAARQLEINSAPHAKSAIRPDKKSRRHPTSLSLLVCWSASRPVFLPPNALYPVTHCVATSRKRATGR